MCAMAILVATMCALAIAAAGAAAAPVGALTQLSGAAGCYEPSPPPDACTAVTGMATANAIAITPNGTNAYAVTAVDTPAGAIVEYARNAQTGALTQLAAPNDCISQGGSVCGTTSGRGLQEATAVAVSPDGHNVYVASAGSIGEGQAQCVGTSCTGGGSVAVFNRDPGSGALTQQAGLNGCFSETVTVNATHFEAGCTSATGISDAAAVVVSPNGDHVYVASGNSNAIAEFKRDPATGSLTQLAAPNDCIAETGSTECGTATAHGMFEPSLLVISADGANIYTAAAGGASAGDGFVSAFHRDAATGALSQVGCLGETGTDSCASARGIQGANTIAISPDGASVYSGSEAASIALFARNAGTGALTQAAGTAACLQQTGGADGCAPATGLTQELGGLAVAPDGASLYAASVDATTGAISEFARASDGSLTQLAPPNDCITQGASACGTTTAQGLSDVMHGITVSPDGEHVYAASPDRNSIVALERADPPPVCNPISRMLAFGTPAVIALSCSDPTGSPLTTLITTAPTHGSLGPVTQAPGSVTYAPATGFFGSDSFAFQASDGSEAGAASAILAVAAPIVPIRATCTLALRSSRVALSRANATTAKAKKKKKKPRATPGLLSFNVRCDQDATLALSGRASATTKTKRPKHKRGKTKAKTRTTVFRVAAVSGRARAKVSLVLSIKLPKAVLSALAAGAKTSATFTLTATNANGSATATASVARLTGIKTTSGKRPH